MALFRRRFILVCQKGKQNQNTESLLSPQQKAEIEKFRAEMLSTRKALRDVQHDLRKNIEGLGTRLRIINIGLIPALVAAFALLFALSRSLRRVRNPAS